MAKANKTFNQARFYRRWFCMLDAPEAGALARMMVFLDEHASALGNSAVSELLSESMSVWDGWPDEALELDLLARRVFVRLVSMQRSDLFFESLGDYLEQSGESALQMMQSNLEALQRESGNVHEQIAARIVDGVFFKEFIVAMDRYFESLASEIGFELEDITDRAPDVKVEAEPRHTTGMLDIEHNGALGNFLHITRSENVRPVRIAREVDQLSTCWSALLTSVLTPHLETLELDRLPEPFDAPSFFSACEDAPELKALRFGPGAAFKEEHLCALVETTTLRKLESLALIDKNLDDSMLMTLADASFEWLRRLDVSENPAIDGEGIAALLSNWKFSELEHLNLSGTSTSALLAASDATYSSSLEELVATSCEVDADVCESFAKSSGLESLRALDLSKNPLHEAGARALVGWPRMRRLQSLRASDCSLCDDSIEILANALSLQKLQTLELSMNQLGARGARALARGVLNNLTALDVSRNDFDEESVRALITALNLSRMKHLSVGGSTDGSILELIMRESELFELETLDVYVTDITPEQMRAFALDTRMRALKRARVFALRGHLDVAAHVPGLSFALSAHPRNTARRPWPAPLEHTPSLALTPPARL